MPLPDKKPEFPSGAGQNAPPNMVITRKGMILYEQT